MTTCNHCGNSIPDGEFQCARCGTVLFQLNCSKCGTVLDLRFSHCKNCGTGYSLPYGNPYLIQKHQFSAVGSVLKKAGGIAGAALQSAAQGAYSKAETIRKRKEETARTAEIATKNHIDRLEFERFLRETKKQYSTGLISGMAVERTDVGSYVDEYRKWKQQEDERKRIEAEKERRRREEEAARAEAERQRLAEEEVRERKRKETERTERIRKAEEELVRREKIELEEMSRQYNRADFGSLSEEERGRIIMANSVYLNKQKMIGTWKVSGSTYANNDLLGLYLREFTYSGIDGEEKTGMNGTRAFTYKIYVTGDETGKCYLMIKGNPGGYCATLGEMAFSEDARFLTLRSPDSNFILERV